MWRKMVNIEKLEEKNCASQLIYRKMWKLVEKNVPPSLWSKNGEYGEIGGKKGEKFVKVKQEGVLVGKIDGKKVRKGF